MNTDEEQAVSDCHARLSRVPGYAGAVVLLYTDHLQKCNTSSTISDEYLIGALESLLAAKRPASPIIVPSKGIT